MVKFDNIVYVGDKVETKFGVRQITKMELMPEPRHSSKCGINVNKMFTNMIKYWLGDNGYGPVIKNLGEEIKNI